MFDQDPAAALVAFGALGANFMGTALLLLFNPRSPVVRWYAAFVLLQLGWLALQGVQLLYDVSPLWESIYSYDVHFMPAVFAVAALVQARNGRTDAVTLLPLLAAVLMLPLLGAAPLASPLTPLWHALAWGSAGMIFLHDRRRRPGRAARRLGLLLALLVPCGVVGAIVLGGAFLRYLLPLMTIAIQLLIFTGVVYHRYYDIEVRAVRSGELAASAAERDRLALLGELAATIAHEVRNPLTGIRSLTQRMAETPLDDDRRAHYAEVILGEITRLDRIVGNLTDLARRQGTRASTSPTRLQPLFDDLALLVEARARRAGVHLVSPATSAVAPTAREPLAQALLNLLLNAVAQSPPGGTVELGSTARDHQLAIHVRDQGPGVPPAERERIFEAFHTGSGGTGLGLSVVRRVAHEQGWSVTVEDAPGGGAEFRITMSELEACES